jgi:hypothetical protein
VAGVRFGAHNGLKSDIAPSLKSASSGLMRRAMASSREKKWKTRRVKSAGFLYALLSRGFGGGTAIDEMLSRID